MKISLGLLGHFSTWFKGGLEEECYVVSFISVGGGDFRK